MPAHHLKRRRLVDRAGLADYVDAGVDQVKTMSKYGKVTLVGHSMGGLTVTRIAAAVPQLIRRVICVSAYVPVNLASGADYSQLPENQDSISGAMVVMPDRLAEVLTAD